MANSTADNPNNIAIGIDLGTTYSCVGVWQYGAVEIIANSQGNRITPSCVAFTDTEQLVGEAAMNQLAENETNTICNIKRLMGREFSDKLLQEDIKHFPFTVKNEGGKFPKISVKYKGKEKLYTPEEISAMVLHEMKVTAENYLGHKITDAVITVPAYFNDAQKQATIDAGKIAELNVLRILQEPTAAAVAFGVKMQSQGQKTVLVFDLGGGTFDVTVMVLENGIFEVKAINGDTHLGGEDFTNRIVDHFVKQIRKKSQNKEDIGKQKGALVQLKTVCEDAKRALSTVTETTITVELSSEDYVGTITRAEFEKICEDLFKKTLEPVKKALADSKLDKSQIDDIILAGGSTRIPKIQRLMKEFFNADNADEKKELNTSIHPDEAIAYGAAIKAAQMTGNYVEQNMLLLDVTPLSLGIQTAGGKMEVLISRNTTIPVQETKKFSPATDNQPTVLVQVYEGERAHARDNILLGRFLLTDLPTPKSRRPEIDVTFDIDANGILTVSAMETSSGKEKKRIFDNKDRHSKGEVQRMIKEAEQNRAEDEQYRQRKDALNNLKILLQHIRDAVSLEKFTSQVNALDQQKIKNKIIEIENWITNNSNVEREKYQEKREELNQDYNAMVGGFRNLNVSPQVGTTRSSTLIIVEDN